MKCKRCGRDINDSDLHEHLGETLCDDCYINIRYPSKTCDPWPVFAATRSREILGLKETEGLTELQRAIYEFVKSNGKVAREGLMKSLNLAEPDPQRQLATLRHCEFLRGTKEDGLIYIFPFD